MDDELSELERQVEAAPADDAAWDRLMLALIARGDPLGDRIRRGAGADDERWLADLAPLVASRGVAITWQRGLVVSARVQPNQGVTGCVKALLGLRVARFLQSLVIDLRPVGQGAGLREIRLGIALLRECAPLLPASISTLKVMVSSPWGILDGLAEAAALVHQRCPLVEPPQLVSSRDLALEIDDAGVDPPLVWEEGRDDRRALRAGDRLLCLNTTYLGFPDGAADPEVRDRRLAIYAPGRANFRLIRRAPREPRFTVSLNERVPIIEPRLPVTVLPGDRLSLPCGATARLCDDELPVRPTEGVAEVAGGVDPIEGTRAFREAMQAISSELSEGVQNFRGRGACHAKWHLKKTLLRERCDVVWRSPQDMDPHTLYD
ncbi:MAG: hypothetical protein AMXMBFR34_51170 [Myxococcaceae bacterium]